MPDGAGVGERTLPLACSIDETYTLPLLVALSSPRACLGPVRTVALHLIHTGLPAAHLDAIARLVDLSPRVPRSALGEIPSHERFSQEAAAPIFLGRLLPSHLDRCRVPGRRRPRALYRLALSAVAAAHWRRTLVHYRRAGGANGMRPACLAAAGVFACVWAWGEAVGSVLGADRVAAGAWISETKPVPSTGSTRRTRSMAGAWRPRRRTTTRT